MDKISLRVGEEELRIDKRKGFSRGLKRSIGIKEFGES
jgi:hypothetical protein